MVGSKVDAVDMIFKYPRVSSRPPLTRGLDMADWMIKQSVSTFADASCTRVEFGEQKSTGFSSVGRSGREGFI
ncbi:hypothetical protein H9L39_04738 [Fusarium oxysporum f. sp. albedinis]|nr:hypothetical protein H9L39_04738 [Fusarium oxysporum f. sp. albedinis]